MNNTENHFPVIQKILHFVFCILFLSVPALFNQYPLIYSDSGQYILSSMTLNPPATSTMGYSFFIRALSWQASLWPVVFMQSFILSLYIFHVLKIIFGERKIYLRHIITVIILAIFSGAGWFTSQIMADFFAAILIMGIFVFISDYDNKPFKIFNIFILLLSVICHFTYVYMAILLFVTFVVVYLFMRNKLLNGRKRFNHALWLIPIILFGYFFTPFYNYSKGYEFSTSRQQHVFLMANLVEKGLIDLYLDDNCKENDYQLCQYKEELPNTAVAFVWDKNSPFYKTGGWNSSKEEYEEIIHDIFSKPKYLIRFIYEGTIFSLAQLPFFEMTYFNKYKEGSSPYDNINKVFPYEINIFEKARQNREGFVNMNYFNMMNMVFIVLSIMSIFIAWYTKNLKGSIGMFVFIVVMGILYNASISATFSTAANRFQGRVVWLLTFIGIILFMKFIYPKLKLIVKSLTKRAVN